MKIKLSKGFEATIDDCDWGRVRQYSWCAVIANYKTGRVYATAREKPHDRRILLHRFILNAPKGVKVDHEDGDGLNCCRSNTRMASNQLNQANRRMDSRNKSG